MATMKMPCASVGSGSSDGWAVTVYEDGKWGDGFAISDFSTSNLTEDTDCLSASGASGSGLALTKNYSDTYGFVVIRFTPSNTNNYQLGTSQLTASMPTIITTGAGRISYNTKSATANVVKLEGIEFTSNQGWFIGTSTTGTMPFKIYGIYFIKK